LHDLNFNCFRLIHACDRQTDGRQHIARPAYMLLCANKNADLFDS